MPKTSRSPTPPLAVGRYALILAAAWTVVSVGFCLWGARQEMESARELIRNEARAHFFKDHAFRLWGASYGGVYVPPAERTPPNPHLSHLPARDVVTTSGKKLTLMNPAYMVRQLMEDYEDLYGVKGRITSIRPLRPENAPDGWERAALESFERGETEAREFTEIDGVPYLRLMRPMVVKRSCLKCHEQQGYKEGDIRGGVGVSVPARRFFDDAWAHIALRSYTFGLVWSLGLIGLGFATRSIRRRVRERNRAEAAREHTRGFMQTVINGMPDAIMVINRDYTIALANRTIRETAGGKDPVAAHLKCHQVLHESPTPCAGIEHRCPLEQVVATKAPVTVEHTHHDAEGQVVAVEIIAAPIFDDDGEVVQIIASCRDIAERQQAQERFLRERRLFTGGPVVVFRWVADEGWPVEYVSPNVVGLLGYAAEDFTTGRVPYAGVVHPGDLERVANEVQTHGRAGVPTFEQEYRVVRSDGEVLSLYDFTVVNRDENDRITHYEGYVLDITERKRAEEALREKTTMLDNILRSARDVAVATTDLEFRITYYNPMAEELFGHTAAEVIGKTVMEVHTKEKVAPERFEIAIEAVRRDGYYGYSVTQETENGPRYLDSWVAGVLDSDGTLVGYSLFSRDITERKQAERELRFRATVLDSIWDGVTATDLDGRITYVNQAELELTGRSRGELIGQSTGVYGEDPAVGSTQREIIETTRARGEWRGEIVNFTSEGNRVVLDCRTWLLRDDAGQPVGMCGVSRDITGRKSAEAERVRLMSAIEQAAEVVVITDAEGSIQYANPAFERITGYTRNEAIGQNPRILNSGEHDDAFYKEMWETLTRGETWNSRIVNKKKDGTFFTEDATISPVRDASGTTVSYVAVKRDVTDEIRLEEQLRQSQKMEAIGQLAGGVAHDFNNILTAILGNAELLQGALITESAPDDARLTEVSQITRAAERAAGLTRQLLAFSRRQVVQPEVLDLNRIILELEKMLRRLLTEDIHLTLQLSDNLRHIRADAGQIEQVAANLVVNARDAMATGGTLTLKTTDVVLDETYLSDHIRPEAGPHVLLSVSDTGCGMDAATLEHIFEPFFTTKEVGRGTGLGLATVHGIIEQAGGHVRVCSEPGMGTTVRIYLPAVDAPTIRDAATASADTPGGDETILLCEDNEPLRRITERFLRDAGYTVLAAESGRDLLALLAAHPNPAHLLVTDVVMRDMNGRQLAEQLATIRPQTRVLYVSGYTSSIIADHGVLSEGIEFLEKPFNRSGLLRRVREVLDRARQEAAAQ